MNHSLPFIVTISRQLGCGGAYVGYQLAKHLNIFYADREIIGQAARQLSVLEEDVKTREEKTLSFWQSFLRSYAVAPDTYVQPRALAPSDFELYKTESEIIRRIAQERSAVIIGRCGASVLRDHPNHISLFLHGKISFRKSRVQKLYGVSEEAAGKMIARNDEERARYNQKFTGREWTDARQYDMTLDTSKTGVDGALEFILKYVELIQESK
ncbi:MAG: cytidylate kinase-like family protein [Smithellaceae bacterium]|nr:cytidylate kinase-like family protein [Smithellaceae bacterium]